MDIGLHYEIVFETIYRLIYSYIVELVSNSLCSNFGRGGTVDAEKLYIYPKKW